MSFFWEQNQEKHKYLPSVLMHEKIQRGSILQPSWVECLFFFFLTQVKLPMFGLFIIHERKIEKKGYEKYLKLRVGLVPAGDSTNIGHSKHVWNNYLFS